MSYLCMCAFKPREGLDPDQWVLQEGDGGQVVAHPSAVQHTQVGAYQAE